MGASNIHESCSQKEYVALNTIQQGINKKFFASSRNLSDYDGAPVVLPSILEGVKLR